MAEENIDAIMFFVGEGRFTHFKSGASDTVGFVKGESQDARFGKEAAGDSKGDPRTQRYGSFAINQFQWRSGQESLSLDDALDDDIDRDPTDEDVEPRRQRSRMNRFRPPSRENMRPKVGCFTVQKEVDIATPTLFLANATGAKFPECHIYFRKSGGTELFTYLHLAFTDVVIEEWNAGVNDRKSDETIVVKFDWCQISYYPQTKTGDRKKEHANIKQFCTTDSENKTPPAGLKEPTR